MNSLPWHFPPSASERPRPARQLAVALLRVVSDHLARTAARLAQHEPPAASDLDAPVLEFHAKAGALEGALYVNGRLVGHLEGVQRL